MMTENKILNIVNADLCVGCGACTAINPSGLKMTWNEYGFLTPQIAPTYVPNGEEKVCPFNIDPDKEVRTEDEIAELFLKTATHHHTEVGRYINTYVGYSNQFRMTSSSGGIATYLSSMLLQQGVVDAVAMVYAFDDSSNRFQFKLVTKQEELTNGSKTKYYPVTYAEILQEIKNYPGKVAISGIGCFIKAIRLLQYYDPTFREKIAFTIGIICGGMKSAFFSDYLANKAGCKEGYKYPEFRVKADNGNALDYSYSCIDAHTDEKRFLRMRTVGDMWGTGYFKANACDFCDDVTTELADISLGDAWLPEYQSDDRGNNVIVTRSKTADELIRKGISNGDLSVEKLPFDRFLRSQRGSFNHRHSGLKYRINLAKRKGQPVPPKRHDNIPAKLLFKNVQRKRLQTRAMSLKIWKETKDATLFEQKCEKYRKALTVSTELYHYDRLPARVINKLKSIVSKSR